MFDEEPDRDPHGECASEIARLRAEVEQIRVAMGGYRDSNLASLATTLRTRNEALEAESAALREQLTEARRCLRFVECPVCGRLFDTEPLPDCRLADHIESHAALLPQPDPASSLLLVPEFAPQK
jgi:hypothetical protein